MTYRQDNPAAIPSRPERASRGRLMARLASEGVGDTSWTPTPVSDPAGPNLVRVYNTGSACKKWEALSYDDSSLAEVFFKATKECSDAVEAGNCRSEVCTLGTCATWPTDYEQVYDTALLQLELPTFRVNKTALVPKPSNLRGWLVAAEAIGANSEGYAYAGGIHMAFVWDKGGLLGAGEEVCYVDLPEYGSGYDSSTMSSPTGLSPLQVRANGRGRVLAWDRLTHTSLGAGSPPWPVEGYVRLALIQRANHFTYPTIPVTITGATETSSGSNRWKYEWRAKHNASLTHEQVAVAYNLTEEQNSATMVGGLDVSDLDSCFGTAAWEVRNASAANMEAMLTMAMDENGEITPYFALQNQVVPS